VHGGADHRDPARAVLEHFAEEQPYFKAMPAAPFNVVLTLDRRVTREGMLSVGSNLDSVPDCTRRRVVEVHALASEIRIHENDKQIASTPCSRAASLETIARHCRLPTARSDAKIHRHRLRSAAIIAPRSLAFYDAVARRLAGGYERGAMILSSNLGFAEWGDLFGTWLSLPPCWIACCTTPS